MDVASLRTARRPPALDLTGHAMPLRGRVPGDVPNAAWAATDELRAAVREWVDFPGATYVEHDGEAEILPGVRLLPAPGHTAGHQIVVVETDEGPVVLGGDVGHWFEELERGDTPGQQLVLELAAPTYLAHVEEVRVPHPRS